MPIHGNAHDMHLWPDERILFYDNNGPPRVGTVALYAAVKPLDENCNKFSFEILSEGKSCSIAIGLSPQKYELGKPPGWYPASIGYHAKDGGIYNGSVATTVLKAKYGKGDVMTCELDFCNRVVRFFKNYALVFTTGLPGGSYPIVAMQSEGESVRLLQEAPWQL